MLPCRHVPYLPFLTSPPLPRFSVSCPGKQEESLPRERQLEKLPIGEGREEKRNERRGGGWAEESERMMFHIRPSQFRLRAPHLSRNLFLPLLWYSNAPYFVRTRLLFRHCATAECPGHFNYVVRCPAANCQSEKERGDSDSCYSSASS